MEEVEDDFGDLYADVEVQVSSAFQAMSNFNQLCTEQEEEKKNEKGEMGLHSEPSDYKSKKVHSNGEVSLSLLDSKIWEVEANGEKDLVLDNASDSEDDLHIVLNEEDCRKYTVPCNTNGGNMGTAHGSDVGDDDMINIGEADRTGKDMKWVDKLQPSNDPWEQSLVSTSAQRGTVVKCSYTPQYSQYKYIRMHPATLASHAKNCGAPGISFSSPLSGRGYWEVNGSNLMMGSSSRLAGSSISSFPVVSKNGCDFSLPRYRTILDVNFESFERKPWRQPGVDITDFFNFGFDEESWKHYCNLLEQFREHSNMLGQIPICEGPLKPQAYEASCFDDYADPEVVETLKGRAIQVEGGIGERQPSMDIRRPRNRESNDVIQISVHDSTQSSSSPSLEEPTFVDSCVLEASENEVSSLDENRAGNSVEVVDGRCRVDASPVKNPGICHTMRSSCQKRPFSPLFLGPNGQENEQILDALGCHDQKSRREVETVKGEEGDNVSPDQAGRCILETIPSLYVPTQRSPSLPCLNNCLEASKSGVCIHVQDTKKPAIRPLLNSISGQQESVASDCNYKPSISNDNKKEWRRTKEESPNQSTLKTEQYPRSRTRLCSVADELNIHPNDESPISGENSLYAADHMREIHKIRKGRKRDYRFTAVEDLSYYKETEISIDYRSAKFIKKQVKDSSSGTFQKQWYSDLQTEADPYLRRHKDDRESFHYKGITARDSEQMQRESYHCEKRYTTNKKSTFEHAPFYRDEERYRWQRRRGDAEYEFKKGDEFYEEYYERDIPYIERDYFQEKYEGPFIENELKRSNRRDRYGEDSSHFDKLSEFQGYDEEWGSSPDRESLPPYLDMESHISYGKICHDSASSENDWCNSWRLGERSVGHCRRLHTDKHRSSSWFDPRYKDHQNVDRTIYYDDTGNHRGRYHSPSNWAKGDFNIRHQGRGRQYDEEPFLYERNFRRESIRVKHDSVHSGMFLNGSRLERDHNRMINVESRSSVDRGDEEAAFRCRDSVDLHLISWEGKSSGRYSKVGDARYSARDNNMGYAFDKDDWSFRFSEEPQLRKLAPPYFPKVKSKCYREFSSKIKRVNQCNLEKYNDKNNEKFQLSCYKEVAVHEEKTQGGVEESENKDMVPSGKNCVSEELAWNGYARENKLSSKDAGNETKVTEGFDNQRILQTLAKMEKRRQRFEKSTISKTEPCKSPILQPDLVVEPINNQQRPARKRRWGGS